MLVSVVLPIFNEEKWMYICLDSLKNQTIPFELIIVDNESTDLSINIAMQYTPLVFTAPRGVINAMNFGVLQAKGDVVVMVNADCFYPPNFIETITRHFYDPNVVMVGGCFYNWDATELQQKINVFRIGLQLFFVKYSPGCATAYKRDAFIEVGSYDPNVDQRNFFATVLEQEIRFHWRIMHLGRIIYEPEAVVIHFRPRNLCQTTCSQCSECVLASQFCQEIAEGERF